MDVAELAAEKGAQMLMPPVASGQQLNDLLDGIAAKLAIIHYTDARDAVSKALSDCHTAWMR